MLIRDWMTRDPVTATLATRVRRACDLMSQHGVRVLPVVDQGHHLLGVVTACGLRAAAMDAGEDLAERPLPRFMDWSAPVLSPRCPVESARRVFAEDPRLEAVPVVEHGTLCGLLTREQAAQALGPGPMRHPAIGPALPCAPRAPTLPLPSHPTRAPYGGPPGTLPGGPPARRPDGTTGVPSHGLPTGHADPCTYFG
jgi:CBS domain-containing protein